MNAKSQEKPDDGLAPCGCRVRFDNDGLIRLAQCNLHCAAPDLLEACRTVLERFPSWPVGTMKIKAQLRAAIEKASAQ